MRYFCRVARKGILHNTQIRALITSKMRSTKLKGLALEYCIDKEEHLIDHSYECTSLWTEILIKYVI